MYGRGRLGEGGGGFGTFGGLMNRNRSFGVVFVCIGRMGARNVRAFF